MRRVTTSLIGLLAATSLLAQEPATQERATQEQQHVVRPGDTLWDLAGHYFNDPFQWRTIYEANARVVENPHFIYPAEVLTIPRDAAGARGARIAGVPLDGEAQEEGREIVVARRAEEGPVRTLFYRPTPDQRRTSDAATVLAEPSEPLVPVRPGEFISAPYLLDPAALAVQGTFIRSIREDRPGRGAAASAHPQDHVYLNYEGRDRPAVDERLMLVAVGRRVEGADDAHRIIQPTGIVRVIELSPDVIEAQIEHQFGRVFPGQLVVPVPSIPEFEVEAASSVAGGFDLQGEILEFVDELALYGPSALAFLDLGHRDGVREGDIFQAYLPARDGRRLLEGETRALPTQIVAELRVIHVTDASATVRVDEVRMARLEAGLPVVRIRKMP